MKTYKKTKKKHFFRKLRTTERIQRKWLFSLLGYDRNNMKVKECPELFDQQIRTFEG